MAEEAQCPDCGAWSKVEYIYLGPDDPIGGFWWADAEDGTPHAGCPACGHLVCVESECEFRDVDKEREATK